jgi:RHS repeat-associated protein
MRRILLPLLFASAALAQESVHNESFQSYATPADVPGWIDTSVGEAKPVAGGLFKTWPDPLQANNVVYGTRQASGKPEGNNPRIGTFSTLTTKTFNARGGFEYRGRMMRTADDARIGFSFLSSYPETDKYYLIGLWSHAADSRLTLQLFTFGAGTPAGTVDSNVTLDANKWYRFAIRVDGAGDTTRIRARFWPDRSEEPATYSIDATDVAPTRLTAGRIGMWAATRGSAYVDDVFARSPVDQTPPVVTFVDADTQRALDPSQPALFKTAARIEIRVTDDISTATYNAKLDGTANYTSASPIGADGTHRITVRAVDEAGNVTDAALDLLVDQLPPVVTLLVDGSPFAAGAIFDRDVILSARIEDISTTTVAATLENRVIALPHPTADEGRYEVSVTATDRVGWQSTRGSSFFVDKTPPAITILANGNVLGGGESFQTDVILTWSATDLTFDRIEATLNGASLTSGTTVTGERMHDLDVKAWDRAGHTTTESRRFILDKTAPEVRLVADGETFVPATTFRAAVTFTVDARDTTPTETVATIDDQPFTPGQPYGSEGRHTIKVVVTNAAGLSTTVGPYPFTVDLTNPTVSLTENGEPFRDGMKFNRDVHPVVTAADNLTADPIRELTLDGRSYPLALPISEERTDHVIIATATDAGGNTATAGPFRFLIDKTRPVVTITEDQSGKAFPADALFARPVKVKVTVADLTPTTLAATLNGQPFDVNTPVTADGSYTLTVIATDAVGWTSDPATATFTIDTTPPRLTFTSHEQNAVVTTRTVVVSGRSDDSTSVTINGAPATLDVDAKTFLSDNIPLVEGRNTITAAGVDKAGNVGRAGLDLELDTRPPEVAITAPAANVCITSAELVVRGTHRDAVAVRVRVDGGAPVDATLAGTEWTATLALPAEGRAIIIAEAVDRAGYVTTISAGVRVDRTQPQLVVTESGAPFTGTLFNRIVTPAVRVADADPATALNVTLNGVAFLAGTVLRDDGSYVLRAAGTDCAGNSASHEHTFTIDRTPPSIVTIVPANGAIAGTRSAITGTLSEEGTLVDETTGTTATVNGVAFTLDAPLVEALNEHVLVVTDRAGNVARIPYAVRLKTRAPQLEIVESGAPIPNDALFNRALTPVIRVSDPDATVTAILNGNAFTSGTSITGDARYTLTATATDSFGHVSDTASATFTIDRTPPKIDITSPAQNASVSGDRVEVRGTVDADAVRVSVNGVTGTISGSAFTASVPLEPGSNLLTAAATDRAGNNGLDRVEVTRDAGPLAIFLTAPPDEMLTNRPTTIVAGQVLTQPPSGTVEINGVAVPVAPGGTFRKIDFPLSEGTNAIVASVANARGETTSVAIDVYADFTPPVLRVTANALDLADGARFATAPVLAVEATDNVPQGLVRELTVDGARVTGAIPALANGGHALSAIARDAAGNETRIDRTFFIGDSVTTGGCGLSAIDPVDGAAVFVDLLRITGRSGGAASVLINGNAAQVADGSFCGEAALQPGRNEILIRCADASGTPTTDPPVTLIVWREVEPSITITSPAPGATLTATPVTVSGSVSQGVTGGDVNGLSFVVTGTTFSVPNVTLNAGLNNIVARAKSAAGRPAIDTTRVTLLNATPQITITSPIVGTETGASTVDVTGTYVHVDPATISVNGAPATTTALTNTSGTFRGSASLAAGLVNTVTAGGRNHAGLAATATVEVQHVAGAPSISITAPFDNATTSADSVTVTGTIAAPDGSQVTVNGVLATLTGNTFSANATLGNGTNPVIARVTTPAGDDAMDAIRVTRVTVLAIRESFPAADATGVDRGAAVVLLFNNTIEASTVVTLKDASGTTVDGQTYIDRDAVTFAPHEPLKANETHTISAAGFTRSFTTAGTAPIAAPLLDDIATTGCFTSVALTGRATPNARVRVDAAGVTRSTTAGPTGAFRITVTFSGQGGFHIVRVREAGSDGSLSAERALCFRLTCELPRVTGATLDRAGRKVVVDFSRAMDPASLVLGTTLLVQPALAGAVNVSGPTATITFNEDVPPVTFTLTVKQSVKDLAGAMLAADYTQSFPFETATQERGKGYVTGAVFDATTGRPLPGANVLIESVSTITNERGRYSRALTEGAYTIAVTAEGYTPAWRQVVVPAGAGVVPIDIRLTRRTVALTSGGDTAITRRVDLASGASVTAVGAQALAGLLPLGWSPLASAEALGVQPGAKLTFQTGSTTRTLSIARYDQQRDEWRVLLAAIVPTDGKVSVDLAEDGHYAVVHPDAAAHLVRPGVPTAGAALQGVVDPCVEQRALCALTGRSFTLEPRAILPNGRAVATLITEGASQIYPSGTAVQATIDEQLNLADGRVLADPPFATDLLLYRTLAGDTAFADFHLAPTPQAAAVTLRDGVERIRIVEYPGRLDRGTLLGSEGGRIPGDGRVTIDVPTGAAPEPLHASSASLPDAELSALGNIAGFRIAGGFTLTLTRATPTTPVEGVADIAPALVIPARATFDVPNANGKQVIVAEVLPRTEYGIAFQLVAIAETAGGTLFTTRAIDSTQLPVDGIVRDGRYVILVADAPIAYAFGIVRAGATGLAVANARVITPTLGVPSITTRSGLFLLPVPAKPASPFTLIARTSQTGDGAPASASASPDPNAFVDFGALVLAAQPPNLRSVTPDGGEIAPMSAFVVRADFDVPIDPASVAGGIRVSDLTGTVTAAGNSVTFNATAPLKAATQYSITIAPTIRGANGAPFSRTVVKTFRTSAIPSNGTVRPELIRITMPDADGRSRIYGTAGALPSGAQAVAVRRDRDFRTRWQATVANDGTFSFTAGGGADRITTGDLIDLQVIDAVSRGIIAVVPLTPFASEDLRTFIAPPQRDTLFLTADGIRIAVPAGAFDVPTAITVTRAAQSAFASVPRFEQELGFGAAVELRFDGIAKKRIDVDLPVPEGLNPAGRTWYAGYLGDSIRGPRVMIVDLAYAANGRIRTGIAPAGGSGGRIATNAALSGPELREYLLGVNRSGIYALVDFQASAGAVGFGVLQVFQQGYDLFWDTLQSLYAAHFYLTEGRGKVAIPVVMGKPFQIVGVDSSTGLEGFAKIYDPIAIGDPGTAVPLPSLGDDRQGPYPIVGSPFRIETVDVIAENVSIESVRDFSVTLKNGSIEALTTLDPSREVTLLNVGNGHVDPSRAGGLRVEGKLGDRIVLLIGEADVDPLAPLTLAFSEPVTDPGAFRLTLDGAKVPLETRLDSGGRRVIFELPASLQRGKTYRLEISPQLADASGLRIGQVRDPNGVESAPLTEPLYLHFKVREPAGEVASFDLSEGVIRDQALMGNVLFVSAMDGGIVAYDVADPAGAKPIGRAPADATSYWALATDHHGRIFATGMTSMMGVVRSFRLEDFLGAGASDVPLKSGASVSYNPGTAAALNIASRVIASDRPEAIPRKLQVLVQDREVPDLDREKLKTLYAATVSATVGDLERLRFQSPFDGTRPYAVQRVTVENMTLDMHWSGDARYGQPAVIEGIVGRVSDRFRVIYNEMTYGVVSLLGYGIAVLDLNAVESNDSPVKKPDYVAMRELVRLTSGKVPEQCEPVAGHAIPNLEFTPDAALRTVPESSDIEVFALDPHRGVLDLRIHPPATAAEAELSPEAPRCDERLSGTGLVFRNTFPAHDHPRLAKLRQLYEAKTGEAPFGRFNAAAPYSWILEAQDNEVVTPASGPGTIALGQRGSPAGERVQRHYILIPANEYGLMVVEVGGDAPAANVAGAPPLNDDHLVDILWIPHGAYAVRTIPRTHLATVVDGQGHVLLVDLARIDERWGLASNELFPTVRTVLEEDVLTPDPRIVWRSKEPLAAKGTLAPVVDPDTGFVYAGKLLEKTTNVISAVDPRIQIKANTGAPNGLSEIGGVVPLGIAPPPSVSLVGPDASLGAFRFEVALPGAIDESMGGAFKLSVESERVFGAKTEDTPAGWPRAHVELPMQRTVPASMTWLRHQRGYNKWISPWVVAIADPRASESYTWPANADRAKEGCYACDRPATLKGDSDVVEIFTNGRLLKARPEVLPSSPYAWLSQNERLTARFATVMADTVRAPQVLVAAQHPPVAGGMLLGTTYLHSGELESSFVDLDAGGRAGWNVVFDRTYRSLTIGGTPLGLGWDSTMYRRLRALPSGDVEYRDGAGEVWRFRSNGNAGYTAPVGLYLGLSQNDRGWTMVTQQGRITQFDPLGRLAFETDEFAPNPHASDQGNIIRYLYGPDGLLRKVIDPVGRESVVTHANGRLQAIKDMRGRTVAYTPDGARLKTVTLPAVANTDNVTPAITYGYEPARFNDRLTSITDLKGATRVTFGYEDERVRTETWATSETATFAYAGNTATVHDALKQERRYTLTPAAADYHSDRTHVTQLDEIDVETSTFVFGQLPPSVSTTPSRSPVTRTFVFGHEEGALKSVTLNGVRSTTFGFTAAKSAPGRLVESSVTAPLSGAGKTLSETFGYKRNSVSAMTATQDGSTPSSLQFAVPHISKLTDSASNDSIAETRTVDPYGRLTNVVTSGGTDPDGQGAKVTYAWDHGALAWYARGELQSINRGGLVTRVDYPSPDRVETTDVDRNVKTTTDLDEWLRPKNVKTSGPSLELQTEIAYDASGRVKRNRRWQEDHWVTEEHFYDPLGRLRRSTLDNVAIDGAPSITETKVDYDLANRRMTRTLPGEAKIIEDLDGLGRVFRRTTVTGGSDIIEHFAYDIAGNLVYAADKHVATAHAYDAHGRVIATLHPDGTRTEQELDALGNPTLITGRGADGAKTSESKPSFMAGGRLQSVATTVDEAQTRTSTLKWDGAGRTTHTAALDRFTSRRFDEAGRLRAALTPFTSVSASGHSGRLVTQAQVAEKGSVVNVATGYDTLGHATEATVGSLTWRQTFDQDSNLTSELRPGRSESARHRYEHDSRGAVTDEHKPGATFRHQYDPIGAAKEYRDPLDPPTTSVNDRIGRPLSRTWPDGTSETFGWDGARLQTYTDREKRSFTYQYNPQGQLAEIRSATGPLETFTYHPSGDLWTWRTRDAELVFEDYDLEHRPRRTRQKRFAEHSGFTTATVRDEFLQTHEWNALGERKAWTVPAAANVTGTRIEERYDAEGNVEMVLRGGATLLSAAYRAAGRPISRTVNTGAASIVRAYGYDASTGQLNDVTVSVGGNVVAGSHIDEFDGVQVKAARQHGLSGGVRANRYTYDDRGRLETSKSAREADAAASVEVMTAADFRTALARPAETAGPPSLTFAEEPGHKIAAVTRDGATRSFSYGAGAERVSDGRFTYEFDARGRLISATEIAAGGRRILYDYSASGRVVGRRAEYASGSEWKLEDRASVLAADALPADATFVWDGISDRLAAVYAADGSLIREYVHGGSGYDDPIAVFTPVGSLYPVFDEAGAGLLQVILNANGDVVSRAVVEGAYGEDESALAGAAVDRIAIDASTTSAGTLDSVTVTIRTTESLDPATVATGARLAIIDEHGAVVRSAPTNASLFDNDAATLRWTLTAQQWTALTADLGPGPHHLSIAVTNTLRATAWSPDLPILPAPSWTNLRTSATLPAEHREPVTTLATWLSSIPPSATRTTTFFTATSLASLATTPTRTLGTAAFQALPFAEPMTGLVYARARWYDPGTGSFLSPDPLGYRDSSNLYAFAGGDPVNRRDPTGESYWVNRSNEIISILWKKRLPGWDNERSQLLAELRDLQEHKYETDPNAPENPGLFAKAVGAGKRWLGLGDELEERYKEKLRTGYPSHDRSDVPPEIAEVYGTEDRGAKLQRDTFEDIGGKGVNYGTQAAQGGVESAAIAGAGFATRGLLKSTQHVDIFLKANPRFRKWVGTGQMHVHHRIPQVYFRDGVFTHDMNSLTNLYALPKGVHEQMVTPAWNKFRKQNPHATRAEVMKFAIQIDQKIARYINTIGR